MIALGQFALRARWPTGIVQRGAKPDSRALWPFWRWHAPGFAAFFSTVSSLLPASAAAPSEGTFAPNLSPTLSGQWEADPMTVRWNVSEWSSQCGSAPKDESGARGPVTIMQRSSELFFQGPTRSYSTLHCYEPLPGLVRRTHSSGRRNWSNLCESAPGDPRRVSIHTTLTASDERIDLAETAKYEYRIDGHLCSASSGRWQTFRLTTRSEQPSDLVPIQQLGGADAAALERDPPCANPGPVARLAVAPDRKLLRPGDTFEFEVIQRDRSGCRTSASVTWSVAQGAAELDLASAATGKISVAAGSPQGHSVLEARAGGASFRVHLELLSSERYEAMLTTAGDGPSTAEAGPDPDISHSVGAPIASAIDFARQRRSLFLGLAGGIALMLVGGGGWLLRRTRRVRPLVPSSAGLFAQLAGNYQLAQAGGQPALPPSHLASPPGVDTRSAVGSRLADSNNESGLGAAVDLVCPCCGTLYPSGLQFCGRDGTALIPVN